MIRRLPACGLLLACAAAGAITIEEIPSPRPEGWVSDVAGILDDGAEQRINAIAEAAHARDGGELAVVTVRSTGSAEPRDFATRLFDLRYGAWFTGYAKCPKCDAVTKATAETTLVAATYDSGGRVRVDEHCEFCGYRHSFERSTPRKTRSSSSGSGFSGGSSSGRGSSGRW